MNAREQEEARALSEAREVLRRRTWHSTDVRIGADVLALLVALASKESP